MTPNPVCYNGVNLPNYAIHVGHVSLGITPKDYRADGDQNWRSGISPDGAIVLYSNTYDLGLEANPVLAEPRIWWTDPAGTVNDYKLKITELLSRLPERASVNYEVFSDYDTAIDWLHNATGKYSLVNDNYPEYFIEGKYCIFNIETGLIASYPGSGLHIHTLANPNETVGNSRMSRALSWHGFTIANAAGDLNIEKIGAEPGLLYDPTGHLLSIDDLPGNTYGGKNIVFEAVLDMRFDTDATVFSLIDSSTNSEVFRLSWEATTQEFTAHYPTLGTIVRYQTVTNPWTGLIHLVASIPCSNETVSIDNAVVFVNGEEYGVAAVAGTDFVWNNSTFIQLGNNRQLNRPIRILKSVKMYALPDVEAGDFAAKIRDLNTPIVTDIYSITL